MLACGCSLLADTLAANSLVVLPATGVSMGGRQVQLACPSLSCGSLVAVLGLGGLVPRPIGGADLDDHRLPLSQGRGGGVGPGDPASTLDRRAFLEHPAALSPDGHRHPAHLDIVTGLDQ